MLAGLNIKYVPRAMDFFFLTHLFSYYPAKEARDLYVAITSSPSLCVCVCVCSKKVVRAVCNENDHSIDDFSITFVFVLESSSFPATSPSA